MGDREFRGTIRPRLKLPGNAACRFVCRIGKIKRAPLYNEKPRWVRLQNRAVSPNFLPIWGKVAQATRLVLGDFNPRTKEILGSEFGLSDRLPNALLRGILDNYRADDPLGRGGVFGLSAVLMSLPPLNSSAGQEALNFGGRCIYRSNGHGYGESAQR